jgi:hypothetical protein
MFSYSLVVELRKVEETHKTTKVMFDVTRGISYYKHVRASKRREKEVPC